MSRRNWIAALLIASMAVMVCGGQGAPVSAPGETVVGYTSVVVPAAQNDPDVLGARLRID